MLSSPSAACLVCVLIAVYRCISMKYVEYVLSHCHFYKRLNMFYSNYMSVLSIFI